MRSIGNGTTTTQDVEPEARTAPGRSTLTSAAGLRPDKARTVQLARQPAAAAPEAAPAWAPNVAAPDTAASDPADDPFGLHLLGPSAPVLARKDAAPDPGATATPSSPADAAGLARGGTRVELPFRAQLEQQFHRDLSRVEVYVGKAAADACAAMGAEAFTVGSMIAFASSTPSLETVRHEVAHVMQQGGDQGDVGIPGELAVTAPGGAEEREAEAAESGATASAPAAATGPTQAAAKPMLAMKPAVDGFCTTTATFEFVATKGTASQGKLPKGTLVQVTAVQSAGFDVVVKSGGTWSGKTGYLPVGAIVDAQGKVGNQVFNEGRLGGTLDDTGTMINCLGHASGEKRGAYISNGTTEDMLKGLGFTCIVGDSTVLAPQIKAGKYAMMVYMYMYKPTARETADQGLSYGELQTKYGWSAASWKQPNVYFTATGGDLPIDYHALDYNAKTKQWEWVSHNRPRDHAPTYDVDSKGTEPAAANPDAYFGLTSSQVLVSIACYK